MRASMGRRVMLQSTDRLACVLTQVCVCVCVSSCDGMHRAAMWVIATTERQHDADAVAKLFTDNMRLSDQLVRMERMVRFVWIRCDRDTDQLSAVWMQQMRQELHVHVPSTQASSASLASCLRSCVSRSPCASCHQ